MELTPAQQFRLELSKLSQEERKLLLLESRWKRNVAKWTAASVKIQAAYRGHRVFISCRQLRAHKKIQSSILGLFEKARDFAAKRQFQDALRACQQIRGLDPHNADSWRLEGAVLKLQGEYREAIQRFARALAANVQDVESRIGKALCECKLCQWSTACDDLDELVTQRPEDTYFLHLRALVNARLKSWPQCVRDLRELNRLLPVRKQGEAIQLALALAADQDLDSAEQLLGESAHGSKCGEALALRAMVRAAQRNFSGAEADARASLEQPRTPQTIAQRALDSILQPHEPLPLSISGNTGADVET